MGKNNKEEYKPNDLVFGQLRGYPWWPGYILKRESAGEYRVVFFGDFTYAMLNTRKIRPFASTPRKFDKKNQKLSQAIKSALRVMKKETTIKRETEAVLKPVRVVRKEDKSKKIKKKRVHKKPKTKKGKSSMLELVNDNLESDKRGGNKMSLSLAMEGVKDEVFTKMAKSERGKGEKNFFDEMIETKSMKPSGKHLKFGSEINKVPNFENEESAIGIIDQKNSLRSLEHMGDILMKKDTLGLKKDDILGKSSVGSKCPSIIEFKMRELNQSMSDNANFSKFLEKEKESVNKANFEKVEKEMLELVNLMKQNQCIGQLEERLKQWHLDLEMKPDFKSIVETNIGKHLTNMRSFCNKRLNETIHYNNVLSKIKDFENIIIDRISKTFFGCEEMNNQSKDLLSLMQNRSPASKDLTILNHSFPSPKFEKQYFPGSGHNIITRRRSNIRQALLKTHQEPKTNKIRKMTEMIYLENYSEKQTSKSYMNTTFDNSKLELKDKIADEIVLEDESVMTMKKETDTETHWNVEDLVNKETQRKVAHKIAKRLFKINGVPQIKGEISEKLGEVIEETIRLACKGKRDYQTQILRILGEIEKSGKEFYNGYLKHDQGICEVRKLKVLLRQNLQCN
jgi:hypothetical protein